MHSTKFGFSDSSSVSHTLPEEINWFYKNEWYFNKSHGYKISSENVLNNIWRAPFSEELEHLVHSRQFERHVARRAESAKPDGSNAVSKMLGFPTMHTHPQVAHPEDTSLGVNDCWKSWRSTIGE